MKVVFATGPSKLYEYSWFAYLLLAFNVLGLGIWPVMLDLSSGSSDLLSYMILVFAIGTCVSLTALALTGDLFKMRDLLVDKRTVIYLSVAGLLNYGIASLLMTYGTLMLSPDVSILVNRSWVLLMVPFIPIILRERVKGAQVLSLVVGFFALYLALTGGTVVHVDYGELPYMLVVLFGALSTAVSSLMIKAASIKLSVQLFLFNFVSLLFFVIALIPLKLLLSLGLSLRPSFALILSSAFVGIVTYFLGAYAYFYALNKLRVTVVGSSLLSVPFITFAFSYLILGEKLKAYFIATALILVAAIGLQSLSSRGVG
ncbi:MAG: DMT family transporter [Thermoprotei archaeon]